MTTSYGLGTVLMDVLEDFFTDPDNIAWVFAFFMLGIFIISFLFLAIDYFLLSFALYRCANNAGYDKPWLAFIPYARHHITVNIPIKKFSFAGVYETYDKKKVLLWYFIMMFSPMILSILNSALSGIFFVLLIIPIIGNIISVLIYMIIFVIALAVGVCRMIFYWAIKNDLMETYKMPTGGRVAVNICSTIFYMPFVFSITMIVLSGKEPVFGYNNYYDPNRFITDDEEE